MSNQGNIQSSTMQHPISSDPEEWKAYWKAHGQVWRTEPEIDAERQSYLNECLSIVPNIQQGIYPFKGIKLSRADVEWLLATHGDGWRKIESGNIDQGEREGLDLRGAELRSVDLQFLPLTHIHGGLSRRDSIKASLEERRMAEIHLEGAFLSFAHLEGADLFGAHLEGANLFRTHLEGADLYGAHLEGAYLKEAFLGGASIRCSFLDAATDFAYVKFVDEKLGSILLGDVHWRDMNVARADWRQIKMLGDEHEARRATRWDGEVKDREEWFLSYHWAVRANRQLAVVLRAAGLDEDAAHFAYRAQKLQRIILRKQRRFGRYLFSLILDLLAGYGYRPGRSVFWYLIMIIGFALAYHTLGQLSLQPPDAFVYSLTSFHGRGFFPGLENRHSLHDPLVMLAAIEAVVGLFIEISFIATFTKRFFGS